MLKDAIRRPKGSAAIGFSAGVVVAVTVLVFAVVRPSANDGGSERPRSPSFTFEDSLKNPLDGGIEVSMEEARSGTPFEIAMPSTEQASADNLAQTWISPNDQVALRFLSDVLITMQIPDFDNAEAEFTELIASGSVKNGHLDVVQNGAALIMDPNTDVDKSNPGSLQFVRDGVSITIYGADLDSESLKDIANSIK